jgi:hypothetical protein
VTCDGRGDSMVRELEHGQTGADGRCVTCGQRRVEPVHWHTASKVSRVPFVGAVATLLSRNGRAHGGITRVDTCSCGAVRRTNYNGAEYEFGVWCGGNHRAMNAGKP